MKPKPLLLKLLKLAGAEKDTFTMKEVRTSYSVKVDDSKYRVILLLWMNGKQ